MKKYVKPELFFERYELSRHVAACAWDLNLIEGVCGYKGDETLYLPPIVIINEQTSGCESTDVRYCETNGGEGMNTFNS